MRWPLTRVKHGTASKLHGVLPVTIAKINFSESATARHADARIPTA
jgi:hypothetical protein